mmetsp:Transcript_9077/g.55337  ORF Transcript_9077/g.55337 Transcript_9077/m.55337 type:complete len:200 (+) Transcript_9077:984-1583(+)
MCITANSRRAWTMQVPVILHKNWSFSFLIYIIFIFHPGGACVCSCSQNSAVIARFPVSMHAQNMLRYELIVSRRHLIQNHKQQIKTREQRVWQSDVPCHADVMIVAAIDWICCGYDTASGIEGCMNPCLCNGDSLLFHHFMDCHPVQFIHLIKFINADNSTICQHHGTCFKPSLARIIVGCNSRGQTYARRSPTCRTDG